MKIPSIIHRKIDEINEKYGLNQSIDSNEWNQVKQLLSFPENQLIVRNESSTLLSVCICGTLDIIKLIYDISPRQIFYQDSNGNTPLHIACADHRFMLIEESIEVIRFLVEVAPKQLEMTNTYGWLPLHQALVQRRNPEIIEILLHANPYAIYLSDVYGNTPVECFFDQWLDELEDNILDLTKMMDNRNCGPEGCDLQIVFGTLNVIVQSFTQIKKEHSETFSSSVLVKETKRFKPLKIPQIFLQMINSCANV